VTLYCESIIYLRGKSGLFGETIVVADEMPFSFAVVLDFPEFMQLPYFSPMNEIVVIHISFSVFA
jgi:hypothetical protein